MSIIPSIDYLSSRVLHYTYTHTATAAVAFNMDRWQIKKTYWLNLSSSATIHLQTRTLLLAFNRKCKRMEIVSEVSWAIFSPFLFLAWAHWTSNHAHKPLIPRPPPPYTHSSPLPNASGEKDRQGGRERERHALEFHPECNRKREQMNILIR